MARLQGGTWCNHVSPLWTMISSSMSTRFIAKRTMQGAACEGQRKNARFLDANQVYKCY